MDKIRLRQLLCVTFLVALAMKMFMLPVLVMRESGRDGFTAMLIALGVDLVVLAVVAAVLHVSEKDLFATLSDAFGGIVSRVVVALFALAGMRARKAIRTSFSMGRPTSRSRR